MTSMRPIVATVRRLQAARSIRGAARLVLVFVAAAIASPGLAMADTPPGTTGGSGIPEPSLYPLLEIAVPAAMIVVGLGIVAGLAFLVARISGPAVTPMSALGSIEPKRSRSAIGTTVSVVMVVGACVVGVLVGRAIAYWDSVGELSAITGAVLSVVTIVAVVGLALIGLIATKLRHGHVSRAIVTILAAAGLLAVGAVGGGATASALGGTYRTPIVLTSPAETHVSLAATSMSFTAHDQGPAECRSEPDGRSVASLASLDLGQLGSGTLRAEFIVAAAPPDPAPVAQLFIDGGSLPEGSDQVFWTGPVVLTRMNADRTSGQLTFSGLVLSTGTGKPAPEPTALIPAIAWPPTLSGSLSWTCWPW